MDTLETKNDIPVLEKCPKCGEKSLRHHVNGNERIGNNIGKCFFEQCGYNADPIAYIKSLPNGVPFGWVTGSQKRNKSNPYIIWLANEYGTERANIAAERYFLGTTRDGDTIFWQITKEGKAIEGEVRRFDRRTGRSEDMPRNKITGQNYFMPEGYYYQLFGEHLLEANTDQTIMIMTDRRLAVEASIVYPERTWLAARDDSKSLRVKIKEFIPDAVWLC